MFREFMGLPAHPLLVHAAVVLVPLLALLAIAYPVLPGWRSRIGWAAGLVAVVAPVSVLVAKESGEELQEVLREKGYPSDILDRVEQHAAYANLLFWWTLALAVLTVLLLVVTSGHRRIPRLPSWVTVALGGLVVTTAVLATIYVYLAGGSGAEAVWQGVL